MESKDKIDDAPVETSQTTPSFSSSDADYEKHGAGPESNPLPDLKRKLKSRHLQMIAIGEASKISKKRGKDAQC